MEKMSSTDTIYTAPVYEYRAIDTPGPWKRMAQSVLRLCGSEPRETKMLLPDLDEARAEKRRQQTAKWLQKERKTDYPDLPPPTFGEHFAEATARQFVGELIGVEPTAPLYWDIVDEDKDDHTAGVFSTGDNVVQARKIPLEGYVEQLRLTSTLIHEFAHSTAGQGKSILVSTPSTLHLRTIPFREMQKAKMDMRSPSLDEGSQGYFFEEAFAEGAAARWRETQPGYQTTKGTVCVDGHVMPLQYASVDLRDSDGEQNYYSYSAFCAYAMELMSEHTGVDLFDLTCQMRKADDIATPQRQFIRAVNSIKPGLYRQLRTLEYGREDFSQGLRLVKDAIVEANTSADTIAC